MEFELAAQVATIVTLLATAGSVAFAALSIRKQTRSSDVETFLNFIRESSISERKLHEARKSSDKEFANFVYVEHFNFLEAVSRLYINKIVEENTADIYREFLINHLAAFRLSEEMAKKLHLSVTDSTTYCYLVRFYSKHRQTIEQKTTVFAKHQDYL